MCVGLSIMRIKIHQHLKHKGIVVCFSMTDVLQGGRELENRRQNEEDGSRRHKEVSRKATRDAS